MLTFYAIFSTYKLLEKYTTFGNQNSWAKGRFISVFDKDFSFFLVLTLPRSIALGIQRWRQVRSTDLNLHPFSISLKIAQITSAYHLAEKKPIRLRLADFDTRLRKNLIWE